MDGHRALGQLRYGYGMLLLMTTASLMYQTPCCWAAKDEAFAEMKVKEVVFHDRGWFHRRLIQDGTPTEPKTPTPPTEPKTPTPPTEPKTPEEPSRSPPSLPPPPSYPPPPPPPPETETNQMPTPAPITPTSSKSDSRSSKSPLVIGLVVAGLVFVGVCGFGVFYWNSKSSHIVKPWVAGLSGQLQKALVTGVQKLNRSELESACEDFSNVIGTSSIGKVFKGTLSSGNEIAVISLATDPTDDWSTRLKTQFRKKIEALSKINHKNFINLIGYCEEDTPFTRMLVFEYSPNGTLYEHLHFQESEHLNWAMRLRILMGVSYCLEYMHSLKPPAIHKNLCSSAISLSDDYAAKVSDFTFWNDSGPTAIQTTELELTQPSVRSNVTCFGKLLFETVTGKSTHLLSSDYIHSWASDYLSDSTKAADGIVDPTLGSVPPAELLEVVKVIKLCAHPNSKSQPSMKEVTALMHEITGIGPEAAGPKISPLWWAELEVISTNES